MRKPHVLSLSVQNLAHFPQLPSRSKIQRWISRALENDAQITVRFVEEEEGRELNKTYRSKDYATNVLTFDYQIEPVVEADLVICVPVLEKESKVILETPVGREAIRKALKKQTSTSQKRLLVHHLKRRCRICSLYGRCP